MSVSNSLKLLADAQKLALDAVSLLKGGKVSILDFPQLLGLVSDLSAVAEDLPSALPELSTLDASEAGQLAAAGYSLVQAVLSALGVHLLAAKVAAKAELEAQAVQTAVV